MSRVQAKKKDRFQTNKDDYVIPPKQKERLEKKLLSYKSLMAKSVDDEAVFDARYKEVVNLGRQSAKDRLLAGKILIDLEKEVKGLGYPFWSWLAAQFQERIPERTARRAMDIASHFGTVANLGDRTITEALKEAQEAKVKKANAQAKEQDHDEDEVEDEKLGKESDTVSDILPISSDSESEDGTAEEDDESADGPNEDVEEFDERYDQDALQDDLENVGDQLQDMLRAMSGDLGRFPDPEAPVKQIDKFIELLDELKTKIPSEVEAA